MSALFAAVAKAQSEFPEVKFDSEAVIGGGRRYRYASLAAILRAVRPVLARHGVAFVQTPTVTEGWVSITTHLYHGDQTVAYGPLSAPLTKGGFHELGSALTYLKRYALASLLGIAADEDEDGHAAENAHKPPSRPQTQEAPPASPQQVSSPVEPEALLGWGIKGRLVDVRTGKAKTSGRPWCKVRIANDAGEEREFWVVKASWQEFVARNQDSKELVWEINGGPPKEGVSTASDITYHTPAGATVHPDFGDVPF